MAEVQSFLLGDDTANIQQFVADKSSMRVDDPVNHPSHYETGKFECIDVMVETMGIDATTEFCVCNAFKYLYRHKRKNGIQDLEKANGILKNILICNR